jgi:WD40 repeat protein
VTDSEWATKIDTLAENEHWDALWRLTQTAPGIWAQRIIMRLNRSCWNPDGKEDKAVWPLLSKLADRCEEFDVSTIGSGMPLLQHNNMLKGIHPEFSPDGVILGTFVGSSTTGEGSYSPNGYRLYRLPEGEHIQTIRASWTQFSPDGKVLLSWNYGDDEAHLWLLPQGDHIKEIKLWTPHSPFRAQFSPDGKVLATVNRHMESEKLYTELWLIPCGEFITTVRADDSQFSPDGRVLLSWNYGRYPYTHHLRRDVHLWLLPGGEHIREINPNDKWINSLFSPDGKVLATFGPDGHEPIDLWLLPGGEHVKQITGTDPRFSPDGKVLATFRYHNGYDNNGDLWLLPEGDHIKTIDMDHTAGIRFSPDGTSLLTFSLDGGCRFRLWGLPDGGHLNEFTGSSSFLSPDGRVMVTCDDGDEGNMITNLWLLPEGDHIKTIEVSDTEGIRFSPDGRVMVTCDDGDEGNMITNLWLLPEGDHIKTIEVSDTEGIRFSPDGKVLVTAGLEDGNICTHLWHLPECEHIKTTKQYFRPGPQFSPDGKVLATTGSEETYTNKSRDIELTGPLGLKSDQADRLLLQPLEEQQMEKMDGIVDTHLWYLVPIDINTPVHIISPYDENRMATGLKSDTLIDSDRHWPALLLALVRHHRRFDIELDEAPSTIDANEYDIEIDE